MQNKTKNIIIIIEFFIILLGFLVINIFKEDETISVAERRRLAQVPEFTFENVFNNKFSDNFEKYVTDQFVERNFFRKIKYLYSMNILKQKDNNKLFVKDNSIYKMEYPLNENAIYNSTQKIKNLCEKNLKGMNVYYSIIPDKNYYLDNNQLKLDYSKIEQIMKKDLDINYIDIKSLLTKEDFYKTDLHWKQENILKVAYFIEENMNLEVNKIELNEKEVGKFYGVYYGQTGVNIEPDIVKYLTNEDLENSITYNFETNKNGKVYDIEKYETSSDKYDVFVSGATPLITIENPNSNQEKELILFRDSFGSSLAPLLMNNYKKITLVDMRYMDSSLVNKFINFDNQDVLFLYSGTVLNQNILK